LVCSFFSEFGNFFLLLLVLLAAAHIQRITSVRNAPQVQGGDTATATDHSNPHGIPLGNAGNDQINPVPAFKSKRKRSKMSRKIDFESE
jgi:hypothetical protein